MREDETVSNVKPLLDVPAAVIRPPRPSRATGSVTLADVAKIAGVSAITVSRAVNRPELVTPATLAHVREVVERVGYVPNLLAGGLASKRTRLVAALVPSITNSIFVDAVQALTDRLWEAGIKCSSAFPVTPKRAKTPCLARC